MVPLLGSAKNKAIKDYKSCYYDFLPSLREWKMEDTSDCVDAVLQRRDGIIKIRIVNIS